jgi:hypothetical protein
VFAYTAEQTDRVLCILHTEQEVAWRKGSSQTDYSLFLIPSSEWGERLAEDSAMSLVTSWIRSGELPVHVRRLDVGIDGEVVVSADIIAQCLAGDKIVVGIGRPGILRPRQISREGEVVELGLVKCLAVNVLFPENHGAFPLAGEGFPFGSQLGLHVRAEGAAEPLDTGLFAVLAGEQERPSVFGDCNAFVLALPVEDAAANAPAPVLKVRVSVPGYRVEQAQVSTADLVGFSTIRDIHLTPVGPQPGRIRIHCQAPAGVSFPTGMAIDLWIFLTHIVTGERWDHYARFDHNGAFTVAGVPAGVYDVAFKSFFVSSRLLRFSELGLGPLSVASDQTSELSIPSGELAWLVLRLGGSSAKIPSNLSVHLGEPYRENQFNGCWNVESMWEQGQEAVLALCPDYTRIKLDPPVYYDNHGGVVPVIHDRKMRNFFVDKRLEGGQVYELEFVAME